jgi:ketosteroid isomerase-like protein
MRKILNCLLLGIFTLTRLAAQEKDATKEINEQVWIPFIKSFSNGDDETFRSVHSRNVVRVIQDSKQIIGYDVYFQKVPDSIKAKWGDWKKKIELRFVQRIADDDKAFEVGYYKTTSTNSKTGEQRTGVGKFHVLMRKENGMWKILLDADTAEGASEELFQKAMPLE